MTNISYAQNYEDIMLWRALSDVEHGVYVDIGCGSPYDDNVSMMFYEKGWSGIVVDPIAEYSEQYHAARERDVFVCAAVGAQTGTASFYRVSEVGLSTMDAGIAAVHEAKAHSVVRTEVQLLTLCELLEANLAMPDSPVHFLKIDAEGSEREVLQGNDWSRFRPWILAIESMEPNSQRENHEEWEPIVAAADYLFVYSDGLNRFYLASEKASLRDKFRYPPNVFDDFVRFSEKQAKDKLSAVERSLTELLNML